MYYWYDQIIRGRYKANHPIICLYTTDCVEMVSHYCIIQYGGLLCHKFGHTNIRLRSRYNKRSETTQCIVWISYFFQNRLKFKVIFLKSRNRRGILLSPRTWRTSEDFKKAAFAFSYVWLAYKITYHVCDALIMWAYILKWERERDGPRNLWQERQLVWGWEKRMKK